MLHYGIHIDAIYTTYERILRPPACLQRVLLNVSLLYFW